ncbi:hypothetical protein EYF80_029590 [Liparis tanakae]|uniref:Uncharacterized protein n=1 Tax=Liparis tanakae TaxID=230148 RepID=A0A4Z2H2P5_9TELE|nr:hypothetical protein EYF80_029590 [Liparis tanakae]
MEMEPDRVSTHPPACYRRQDLSSSTRSQQPHSPPHPPPPPPPPRVSLELLYNFRQGDGLEGFKLLSNEGQCQH